MRSLLLCVVFASRALSLAWVAVPGLKTLKQTVVEGALKTHEYKILQNLIFESFKKAPRARPSSRRKTPSPFLPAQQVFTASHDSA